MTNRRARLLGAPLLLTLSLVLAACGGDDDDSTVNPPAAGSGASGGSNALEVTIENFRFAPAELTGSVGTTVRITNKDGAEHNWRAKDGTFKTDLLGQDESTEVTLDKAGTYDVLCTVHPQMTGSVTVE